MKDSNSKKYSKKFFMKIVYLFPLLVLFFVLIVGNIFGLPPSDGDSGGSGGGPGRGGGTGGGGGGSTNCPAGTEPDPSNPGKCRPTGGGGSTGSTTSSETDCGVAPPAGSSTPTSGTRIFISMDLPNELNDFKLDSDGKDCQIFAKEEDPIRGDTCGANANYGKIIKTDGRLSDGVGVYWGDCDSDAKEVIMKKFGSSVDDSACDDCGLQASSGTYSPKGGLLCGSDGKWYLCDKELKFYKIGDKAYRCTKENEWKNAEICDNGKDDDDDTKIDCEDENCYGTDSALINLESGQTIKCHDKDLTTDKVFYHPSCEPDNDKDKTVGQTRALNICEQQGLTFSFRKKYNYAVNPALPQDNLNQCCGDDAADCGKVETVSSTSSILCAIDVNNQNQFSKWIRSDGNSDAATGGGHGNIKYVPCNKFEYLSNDNKWTKCAGVFEGNINNDKNLISANNHHYLCLGSGQGSVIECCGDLSRCNSKGPDGQRLKTGEFRTKKCGNGVADAGEQCGDGTLSCPSGQTCNGCVCSGTTTTTCSPTDQCRTNTDCPSGQTCSNCNCVTSTTQCPSNSQCQQDSDCIIVGQQCINCACTTGPTGSSCTEPGAVRCDDGTCKVPVCTNNDDCGESEICILAGKCNARCISGKKSPTGDVVAIDSITGNSILEITGYATGTPDESATVNSIAAEVGLSGLVNEYDSFHRFVKVVAQRLNPTDDPSGWGLLSKSSGEKNVDGFAVDAIIYGTTQQVVDIVSGSGSNPSPSWQLVSKRPNNNWVAPSAAGRTSGSSSGTTTGRNISSGTSSGKYYCTPQGTFEFKTLDTPSPRQLAPNYNNKFACIGAGLTWTGTKCCGEPDQRPEYYNDPADNPANTETSPNRFPNGCTGSCDAPYFRLKYEHDVLNSIIAVGGVDLSTQARVDSYRQAVLDELKKHNFVGAINPINCNGNPSRDSIIIGKSSDQYAEYYDIVIGHGTPNPTPGIGYAEPANWKRCPGCGKSSPVACTPPTTSGTTGSSDIGGCWNSKFVSSISFVEGSKNSVINYKGQFYGCAIDKKNYNKENDNYLTIKDSHTKIQLIKNQEYCKYTPDNNYYCSYTEKWEQTNGLDKSHLSASPLANARQKSECCAAMECWDGEKCVENQKDKPLAPLLGGSYKCIDGNWKKLPRKCTPDENACGYCGEESQCLLNPLSQNVQSQCLNSGDYSGDDYCDNGQWSTRTKLIALKLLGMKTSDYTLFCDNKQNTLNNLIYITDSGEVAETLIVNLQTNNFCVLKNKDKTIVATSMNKGLEEVKGGFSIFGISSCSNAKNDSNYYSCDNTNRVWYNKKLKSVIYSASPIAVTQSQEPSSSLFGIIKAVIDAIKRLIIPQPFDESYVNSIKKFDKLFLAKQGQSSISGAMEGITFKNAVIEYVAFDKINICDYVNSFNQAGSFTLSGISCRKEGNNYYVLAQGSEFTSFNPESVWLDLTAKLRLK